MYRFLLILSCAYLVAPASAQTLGCSTCATYTLVHKGDVLRATSKQNAMALTMHLRKRPLPNVLTLAWLRTWVQDSTVFGTQYWPDGTTRELRYVLMPYRDTMAIYLKGSNGWFPLEDLRVEKKKLRFTYNEDYTPPAVPQDLAIVDTAMAWLGDSTRWNRSDDRLCAADSTAHVYSLFCALKVASELVAGEYNHRNAVMQNARIVVMELHPERDYGHPIMHFNNDPRTLPEEMTEVLRRIRQRLEVALEAR